MAFTQQQLDELDEMIALGILTAEYRGKKVTYRSQKELLEARARIARALGKSSRRGKTTYPKTSKGL